MTPKPFIGTFRLGSLPSVALAVGGWRPGLRNAYQAGVSILEARLDLFPRKDTGFVRGQLGRLRGLGLPLLATFRPRSEGGSWAGGDGPRRRLLLDCLDLVDAVDLELRSQNLHAAVAGACTRAGKTLIVSSHFLSGTPPDATLRERLAASRRLGADIVKLACLAREDADAARLMALIWAERGRGVIGISMGPKGAVSRVAAPIFGSLLTYTSLDLRYGQLPLKDLVRSLAALYPAFAEDLKKRRHPLKRADAVQKKNLNVPEKSLRRRKLGA